MAWKLVTQSASFRYAGMKIIVADRQDRVRFALRMLLERMLGLKVMGETSKANELSLIVTTGCPDLLLLDWELPDLEPSRLITELRIMCPKLRVIAVSSRLEMRQFALDSGADAFVNKAAPPEALLEAINACRRSMDHQHADFHTEYPRE